MSQAIICDKCGKTINISEKPYIWLNSTVPYYGLNGNVTYVSVDIHFCFECSEKIKIN